MDGYELYKRAKALWPQPVPHTGDKREALNKVYWPLEERLGHDDEWLRLAAWAFHQALWEHAISAGAVDSPLLSPADVPFSIFDRYMRDNLQHDSWSDERTQYSSSLPEGRLDLRGSPSHDKI